MMGKFEPYLQSQFLPDFVDLRRNIVSEIITIYFFLDV